MCATIHRDEVRRKVIRLDSKPNMWDARAYTSNHKVSESRIYTGKRLDIRCDHCIGVGHLGIGHTKDRCWVLHPELKPKFNKDGNGFFKATIGPAYKDSHVANLAVTSSTNHAVHAYTSGMLDFTSNPTTLIIILHLIFNIRTGKVRVKRQWELELSITLHFWGSLLVF